MEHHWARREENQEERGKKKIPHHGKMGNGCLMQLRWFWLLSPLFWVTLLFFGWAEEGEEADGNFQCWEAERQQQESFSQQVSQAALKQFKMSAKSIQVENFGVW